MEDFFSGSSTGGGLRDGDRRQEHQRKIKDVFHEVGKVVVGQQHMLNRLLIGLFTNGHILLEGVPGLAKTLTVNTLAQALHLDFKRLQFTPDLLPADLIGTMIYNQAGSSTFCPGLGLLMMLLRYSLASAYTMRS